MAGRGREDGHDGALHGRLLQPGAIDKSRQNEDGQDEDLGTMTKVARVIPIVTALALGSGGSAGAHHSHAMFDMAIGERRPRSGARPVP